MNKTVLWIIIGVLVIAMAVLGYMVLSREFEPENPANAILDKTDSTKDTANDIPESDTAENNDDSSEPTADYRDFTIYTYEGDAVTLSEIVKEGKPVVINFWTTWCTYCKEEMPDFNEVYKEYADRVNFMMIDVNGGGNDDMDKAYDYIDESDFEFPVYYDSEMSAAQAYGLTSFPTSVVIDTDGVMIYAYPGMLSKQNLVSLIEHAIK